MQGFYFFILNAVGGRENNRVIVVCKTIEMNGFCIQVQLFYASRFWSVRTPKEAVNDITIQILGEVGDFLASEKM